MKIALNCCYGRFNLSNFGFFKCKQYGLNIDNIETLRIDEEFIHLAEVYRDYISGNFSLIRVFVIPDYATNWKIVEYDGYENVIYVVDGEKYII